MKFQFRCAITLGLFLCRSVAVMSTEPDPFPLSLFLEQFRI